MKTNYKFGEVFTLSPQIAANNEQPQFKNIFSTSNGEINLLALSAGQKLDTHLANAEVMVTVLSGKIFFKMFDTVHEINTDEFMLVGAEVPHSVEAAEDSKILLVKIKN